MGLLGRCKRFVKRLRKRAGFTLTEVSAVVAISGTLAAIAVPVAIDQIEAGRVARAKTDVDTINSAIQAFFKDTGEWPDRTSVTDPDGVLVLRSGKVGVSTPTVTTLGTAPGPGVDPKFSIGAGPSWVALAPGRVDALVNHLTLDNPGGTTTTPNGVYRAAGRNWNGPYMPQIFNDPWGDNYLVSAKAFTTARFDNANIFVWVISAGPNKTIETAVMSPDLNDRPTAMHLDGVSTVADDIGVIIFRAREAIPGVSSGGGSALPR